MLLVRRNDATRGSSTSDDNDVVGLIKLDFSYFYDGCVKAWLPPRCDVNFLFIALISLSLAIYLFVYLSLSPSFCSRVRFSNSNFRVAPIARRLNYRDGMRALATGNRTITIRSRWAIIARVHVTLIRRFSPLMRIVMRRCAYRRIEIHLSRGEAPPAIAVAEIRRYERRWQHAFSRGRTPYFALSARRRNSGLHRDPRSASLQLQTVFSRANIAHFSSSHCLPPVIMFTSPPAKRD